MKFIDRLRHQRFRSRVFRSTLLLGLPLAVLDAIYIAREPKAMDFWGTEAWALMALFVLIGAFIGGFIFGLIEHLLFFAVNRKRIRSDAHH